MMLKLVALITVCASISMTAEATPIAYTLSGVTFANGGTATGSFVYNADNNVYSSIDIVTTGAFAFHFDMDNGAGVPNGFDALTSANSSAILQLDFLTNLTNAGGTAAIGFNGFTPFIGTATGGFSVVATGSVTSVTTQVPEPATIGIFGLGLAALVAARRRNLSRGVSAAA